MNFTIAKNIGIIAAVGVFLISSIYAPRVNIEDRAIVHAVGVDKAGEDYEVSLQVFSTTQSGSNTPIDPSQPNMKVISAKGLLLTRVFITSADWTKGNRFMLPFACLGYFPSLGNGWTRNSTV